MFCVVKFIITGFCSRFLLFGTLWIIVNGSCREGVDIKGLLFCLISPSVVLGRSKDGSECMDDGREVDSLDILDADVSQLSSHTVALSIIEKEAVVPVKAAEKD